MSESCSNSRDASLVQSLRARLADFPWRTVASFFLLGVINNVLYVVILSAALDLVGAETPKSVVLLANILPSVLVKFVAPYVFDYVPHGVRVGVVIATNVVGMILVSSGGDAGSMSNSLTLKLSGIAMASAASGIGEITFLQITHRYGVHSFALAAWSSGTGGAGIAGGLLYVACTTWLRTSPTRTLLGSALLPLIMAATYFVLLPDPLIKPENIVSGYRATRATHRHTYTAIDDADDEGFEGPVVRRRSDSFSRNLPKPSFTKVARLQARFKLVKPLVLPYMTPLFLVYFAEYTINQGLSPTLLFDLNDMPFSRYRDVYPTYATLYQVGVFISRSSSPFVRVRRLYFPALGQRGLLILMLCQALFFMIPTIKIIFVLILVEGIFGGLVYVNAFHNVSENEAIHDDDREFSIAVIGVADSFGILIAALISLWLEPTVCRYQVNDGRPWCRLE